VPGIVNWIRGDGPVPQSIDDAVFQQIRLRTLRSRLSAAYKGLHALLMREGCRDFITGKPVDLMTFFNDKIDIHHIFPRKWCMANGIKQAVFNSIVNKTALFKKSNITISGHAPSVYLKKIEHQQGISAATLDDILRSHLIEPAYLRNDDFSAFMASRTSALSNLISSAMSKAVVQHQGTDEIEREVEDVVDELEDADEAELENA
jgi:hypothetical protein